MSKTLPRLRMNLDFMPSPVEDRPGLLIRDPYLYSEQTLIIPPPLVAALELFDGESTELDLRQTLVEITGDLQVGELEEHLQSVLSDSGFLEDERFEALREARHGEFAAAEVREAAHSGSAYPEDPVEFQTVFARYLQQDGGGEVPAPMERLCGIAAPHVSPFGGRESYRDAYRALAPELAERVFVVLGTSHYGAPEKFGLTRKNFVTPLGETRTERGWVERLERAAPGAVIMEDYCHATEHSIEFQTVFLQHIFGPEIRVLPVLVGPYARSVYQGGMPEDDENVRRFLDALGEMNAAHRDELIWVLGVDMAHIGRRYGNPRGAVAHEGEMMAVAGRDKDRIRRIEAGDAAGFWEMVRENRDDLNWCGSAPFYTFLRAVPEARGRMLRYQHWQIDPGSVVSFAALDFGRRA